SMLRACGRLKRLALLGDKVVSYLQGLLWATGRAQVEAILATDNHHRYASDLVGHGQFLGLFHLAFDGEGVEGLEEGITINALGGDEIGKLFGRSQLLLLLVDGVEHGVMHL